MQEFIVTAFAFLAAHGYAVVFVWMFADQAALPLPSLPLLVAAGALCATGDLDLTTVIATATVATLLADTLWYLLGRYRGASAIALVCKLALEPDSCVSATRTAFGRYGPATLVIAKYLPGVQTLAPASVGFVRAPLWGFLLLDLIGTLLFVVPAVLGGYFFQTELAVLVAALTEVSGGIGMVLGLLIGGYLMFKAVHWVLFLREHRLRRITPPDLHRRISNDEPVTVIDLRQRLDFEALPVAIPGALRIPISEIRVRRGEIPLRHDVVLVCT